MGKIALIPTPIGNLSDITLRAIEYLKNADLIAAEDTRQTGKLLNHLGISKPMVSLHTHNEHFKVIQLIEQAKAENFLLCVCSDAGTPGVSDPGFLIVREGIAQGLQIETLPGATAFVPALVNSGLPCDRFVFEGFLPQKKGRQTRIRSLENEMRTMVFYESPNRLLRTLEEFSAFFGPERKASVSRELSKIYEENPRGSLEELIAYFSKGTVKGEVVIVLAGKE